MVVTVLPMVALQYMWDILETSLSVLASPYHLANGAQPVTSSIAGCGEGGQCGLWRGIV